MQSGEHEITAQEAVADMVELETVGSTTVVFNVVGSNDYVKNVRAVVCHPLLLIRSGLHAIEAGDTIRWIAV